MLTSASSFLDRVASNPVDQMRMGVPLLIRILEFAREDAKTDIGCEELDLSEC